MNHAVFHVLIRAAYPALYWLGFAVTKALTGGKANIMPYSALGAEEDAAWWEFRIRRWGFKEWRPESMIIFGAVSVFVAVSAGYVCRYLL